MGYFRALDCIEYSGDKPVINVSIYGRGRWIELEAPIDTGFSGEILLPQEVYYELFELELPRSLFPIYTTTIGEVVMRRSIALIKVFNIEFEGYIETPLYGGGKYLVGRKLLEKLDIALLGRRKKVCNLQEIKNALVER